MPRRTRRVHSQSGVSSIRGQREDAADGSRMHGGGTDLEVEPTALYWGVGEEDCRAKRVNSRRTARAWYNVPKVTSNPVLLGRGRCQ